MVMAVSLLMLVMLLVSAGQTQRTPDYMMEYLQRQIQQLEERVMKCEQDHQLLSHKLYSLSQDAHAHTSATAVLASEVKGHYDGLSLRLDRVERDVEYLQSKVPDAAQVEVEESLLEHQLREAQQKKTRARPSDQDCSWSLAGIKSLRVVKHSANPIGSWTKEAAKSSSRIYVFSGGRNHTLLEYTSLKTFTQADAHKNTEALLLPRAWQGTGHALYNGFLYYHQADTPNEILKVHLRNRTVTERLQVPGAGRMPVYALNPHTLLDLALDETGLWSIHADPDYGGNLVVSKLGRGSLEVEGTWDTSCSSRDAEAAFIICGTLYVAYNGHYGGRSSLQCRFHVHHSVYPEENPRIFFPKAFTSHASLRYQPRDQQLYAWDDGYQTIYTLDVLKTTPGH